MLRRLASLAMTYGAVGLAACSLPAAELVGETAGTGGTGGQGGADACPGAPPPLELLAVADAIIDASEAAVPHGDDIQLKIRSGDKLQRSLLRFDLGSLPSGSVICRATLELTPVQSVSGALVVGYHRVTAPWLEDVVTWATHAGSFGPESTSAHLQDGAMTPFYVDLTDDVRAMVEAPLTNFGWLLKARAEAGPVMSVWPSSRTGSAPPVLTVLYTSAP